MDTSRGREIGYAAASFRRVSLDGEGPASIQSRRAGPDAVSAPSFARPTIASEGRESPLSPLRHAVSSDLLLDRALLELE